MVTHSVYAVGIFVSYTEMGAILKYTYTIFLNNLFTHPFLGNCKKGKSPILLHNIWNDQR